MQDDINILLQSILDEQRESRNELISIHKSMVKQDEFLSYREEMKERFEEIIKNQDNNEKIIAKIEVENGLNSGFRKSLINGIKYIAGATFVAVLGILGTVISNSFYYKNHTDTYQYVNQGPNSAYVSQSENNLPPKAIRLKVPNSK